MALAEYVNQTLDGLLKENVSEFSGLKQYAKSSFAKKSLDAGTKMYLDIMEAIAIYSQQFRGLSDPKVNKDLRDTLGNFISKALKDNDNPSQLYRKILDVFRQEIFSNRGRDELIAILLSKIYMDARYISKNINPITKEYDRNITREDREEAAKIIAMIIDLLVEAIYRHWTLMGKKITREEIRSDLKKENPKYISGFYGIWEGVKSKIENEIKSLTPDEEVKEAVNDLVINLENIYLSFIKGLMKAAYTTRPVPEYIVNVVEYLSDKDFFKNVFGEMYNEIGNYINQLQPQIAQELQLDQPSGQQQGQQANQPHQNNQQGQQTP